jgi:hypothetical protein
MQKLSQQEILWENLLVYLNKYKTINELKIYSFFKRFTEKNNFDFECYSGLLGYLNLLVHIEYCRREIQYRIKVISRSGTTRNYVDTIFNINRKLPEQLTISLALKIKAMPWLGWFLFPTNEEEKK